VQAVIPLAGIGLRLRSKQPKSLLELNGKPMLYYVLRQCDLSGTIDSVIVVTQKKHFKYFRETVERYKIKKQVSFVEGGATRSDSVFNGLKALDNDTKIVLIHDGARPLIEAGLMDECVDTAVDNRAVIAAVPVKPTIKRVDVSTRTVEATLDRSLLWEVQTPQVFHRDLICRAYDDPQRATATDDASLVERLGVQVKVVEGDFKNIKITTPEDIMIASGLLKKKV
jgi:2-C-methyl-D-erythritol 4-phosphate cytidylyltransferase